MPCLADAWPNWREEEQYAWLLDAERATFAWEWMRRSDGYRKAFEEARASEEQSVQEQSASLWGLHRFEPPQLRAAEARPIWRREPFPYVLQACAEQEGPTADRLDLGRFAALATLYRSSGGVEHLLLSDGMHTIRVDVLSGSLQTGPARLRYRLAGLDDIDEPLMVLRRLAALWRTDRFSPALHRHEVRAGRWIAMLRAGDALQSGATQREIAETLVSRDAAEPRWRISAPTARSRAQRLVRASRDMAAGGYRSLLLRPSDGRG